jgi:excisionase family DNA binding protein
MKMHKKQQKKYLSCGDAANRLGVSRPTVQKLIDNGHLLAVCLPGMTHRRIPAEALAAYEAAAVPATGRVANLPDLD